MITDIKYSRDVSYRGRNGSGTMTGISVWSLGRVVSLTPFNKRGNSNAAELEIPAEDIDTLIEALEAARAELGQEPAVKIFINVTGGVVDDVTTTSPMKYVLIDWDNIQADEQDNFDSEVSPTTASLLPVNTKYSQTIEEKTAEDTFVVTRLKTFDL